MSSRYAADDREYLSDEESEYGDGDDGSVYTNDSAAASEEARNALLDLVEEDMDLGLDTASDDEPPPFNLERYIEENPEGEEMLRAIPEDKLESYWMLFAELDYDGSNQVSAGELHEAFDLIGIPVDADELNRIIAETDEDGSGEIDFAEFAHMLWMLHKKMLQDPIDGGTAKYLVDQPNRQTGWVAFRIRVWEFLENPGGNKWAQAVAGVIIALILLSCVTFVVESLPAYHRQHDDVFYIIEVVCVVAFTVEYVVRLIAAPAKCEFMLQPLSIVDLVSVAPFYTELLIQVLTNGQDLSGSATLRIVRLIRVFRLFKMSRYLGWLVAVNETLQQSVMPLGMIIFVFFIGVIVFSSAVYYMERGDYNESLALYVDGDGKESQFQSIVGTFWWCIITMTTVGYGDVVPKTAIGRFIAAGASLTGVLILAIPISVISANFHTEYAKMIKKRGTTAQHKRILAAVQESAVKASTSMNEINRTIIKSAATLFHANSRLMLGNMKHVELNTRNDLTEELLHDMERTVKRAGRRLLRNSISRVTAD